jgi:hypothetical protein
MGKDILEVEIMHLNKNVFSSLVILVKKKDKSQRMVLDYREFNKLHLKISFSLLPLINY